MRTTRQTLPWLLLGLLLALPAVTRAADAGVKDDGGFFSPTVAQQASDKLKALDQKYRHKVVLETFATPPNELTGKLDGNDASKQQAYVNFMEMRARSTGADVYIYASKSPGHLDSIGRKDVAQSGLTDAGRRRMTSDLLAGFKNRDFDGALTNLTASLERTFAETGGVQSTPSQTPSANAPTPAPSPRADSRTNSGSAYPTAKKEESSGGLLGGFGCFGLVIAAVVIFIVISLVKRLFGGNRNAPPPLPGQGYGNQPGGYGQGYGQGYNQGGGGGFGRGLGGGILGGLLGSWIGGNVFGGQSHSSGNDQNSGGGVFGGGQDSGSGGGDSSGFSSGGGGDFGSSDNSGGSDFSSGGGGDFGGGGDSGGGGGDSGGGGGDF